MKIKLVFAVLVVCAIISLPACNNILKNDQKPQTHQTSKVEYSCPMHPDVVQDKPGKCPKCGMDLQVKDDKKER